MKTFLLALDQASNTTGFAVYKNQKLIAHGHKTFTGNTPIKRIEKQRQWVDELIQSVNGDIDIVIEDIQLQNNVGNSVSTFKMLAQLQGALLTLFEEQNIDYYIAIPNQWRKTCGIPVGPSIKRPQQKAAAREFVKKKFGFDATEDEADACAIGWHIIKSTDCYDWSE